MSSKDLNAILIGDRLGNARQHLGLSLDDVAAEINIDPKYLRALEQNKDIESIPQVFVDGYMRSYGRFLGVDVSASIKTTVKKSLSDSKSDGLKRESKAQQDLGAFELFKANAILQYRDYKMYYGIALLLVLMLALWLSQRASVDAPERVDISEIEIETPKSHVTADLSSDLTEPVLTPVGAVVGLATEQIGDVSSAALALGDQKFEVDTSDSAELSFYFSADCWLEVRDADNNIIFQDMAQADRRIELKGKAPFGVTLGYAPAASVSYNGERVSIPSDATSIAKLVIGNS